MGEGRLLVGAQVALVERVLAHLEHIGAGQRERQRAELSKSDVVIRAVGHALVGIGGCDSDALGGRAGMQREGELPALKLELVALACINHLVGGRSRAGRIRGKRVVEHIAGVIRTRVLIEGEVDDLQAILGAIGQLDLKRVAFSAIGHAMQRAHRLSHRVLEGGRAGTLQHGAGDGDVTELDVAVCVVRGSCARGRQRGGDVGSRESFTRTVDVIQSRAVRSKVERELARVRGKKLGLLLIGKVGGNARTLKLDVLVNPGGRRYRGVREGVGDGKGRNSLLVIHALSAIPEEAGVQRAVLCLNHTQHDRNVLCLRDTRDGRVVLGDDIGDVPAGGIRVVGSLVLLHEALKLGHGERELGREGNLARGSGVLGVVHGLRRSNDLVSVCVLQAEREGVVRAPRATVDGLVGAQDDANLRKLVLERERRGVAVERPAGTCGGINLRLAGSIHGDNNADGAEHVAVGHGALGHRIAVARNKLAGQDGQAVLAHGEVLGIGGAIGKRGASLRRHREDRARQSGEVLSRDLRKRKRGGRIGKREHGACLIRGRAERPSGPLGDVRAHSALGIELHRHGLGADLIARRCRSLGDYIAIGSHKLAGEHNDAVGAHGIAPRGGATVGKRAALGGRHGELRARQQNAVLGGLGKHKRSLVVGQRQSVGIGDCLMVVTLAHRKGHGAVGLVRSQRMTRRRSGLNELVRALLEVVEREHTGVASSASSRDHAGHDGVERIRLAAHQTAGNQRVVGIRGRALGHPVEREHGAVEHDAVILGVNLAQACLAHELIVEHVVGNKLGLCRSVALGNREVIGGANVIHRVGARSGLHQTILTLGQAVGRVDVILGEIAESSSHALLVVDALRVAHGAPRALGVGREARRDEGAVGLLSGVGIQVERHVRNGILGIAVEVVLLDAEAAAHHRVLHRDAELLRIDLGVHGVLDLAHAHVGRGLLAGQSDDAGVADGDSEVRHGDMALGRLGLRYRVGAGRKPRDVNRARAGDRGAIGIGDALLALGITRPGGNRRAGGVLDRERHAVQSLRLTGRARLAVVVVELVEAKRGGDVENGAVYLVAVRIDIGHIAIRIHGVVAGLGPCNLDDAVRVCVAGLVVCGKGRIVERPCVAKALVPGTLLVGIYGPFGLDGNLLTVNGLSGSLPSRRCARLGVSRALKLELQTTRKRIEVVAKDLAPSVVEPNLQTAELHRQKLVGEELAVSVAASHVDRRELGVAVDHGLAANHLIAALDNLNGTVGVGAARNGIACGKVLERHSRGVRPGLTGHGHGKQVGAGLAGGVEHLGLVNRGAVLAEPLPRAVIGLALDNEGRAPGAVGRGRARPGDPSVGLVVPHLRYLELGGDKRVGDGGRRLGAVHHRALRGAIGLVLVALGIGVRHRVTRVVRRVGEVDDKLVARSGLRVVNRLHLNDAPSDLVLRIADIRHSGQVVPRTAELPGIARNALDSVRSIRQLVALGAVLIVGICLGLIKRRSKRGKGDARLAPLGPRAIGHTHACLQHVVRGGTLVPLVVVVAREDLGEADARVDDVLDVADLGVPVCAHGAAVGLGGVVLGNLGLGDRVLPGLAVRGPLHQVADSVGPLRHASGRAAAVAPIDEVRSGGVAILKLDYTVVVQALVGRAVLISAHDLECDGLRTQAERVVLIDPELSARDGDVLAGILVKERGLNAAGHIARLVCLIGVQARDLVAGLERVRISLDIARGARGVVPVDRGLDDLVLIARARGVVYRKVGEREGELSLAAVALKHGRGLRLLGNLGPRAVGGLAVERHSDVG